MTPLPKTFIGRGEVKGFKFAQIDATDKAYLYEVESMGRLHYEVFKKRENARFGTVSYPTSKAFGIWAWTCSSYERAIERFNQLNKKENDKQ